MFGTYTTSRSERGIYVGSVHAYYEGDDRVLALVRAVHSEVPPPYFTVELASERERQTSADKLLPLPDSWVRNITYLPPGTPFS